MIPDQVLMPAYMVICMLPRIVYCSMYETNHINGLYEYCTAISYLGWSVPVWVMAAMKVGGDIPYAGHPPGLPRTCLNIRAADEENASFDDASMAIMPCVSTLSLTRSVRITERVGDSVVHHETKSTSVAYAAEVMKFRFAVCTTIITRCCLHQAPT